MIERVGTGRRVGRFAPAGAKQWWWWLLIAVPASAPSVASERVADVVVVRLTNTLAFTPGVLTIRPGQIVEWRNNSLLVHTVTANPALVAKTGDVALPVGAKPFNSGNLKPGQVYRYTFTVPGRYRYFCVPHEGAGMIGEVVVRGVQRSGP